MFNSAIKVSPPVSFHDVGCGVGGRGTLSGCRRRGQTRRDSGGPPARRRPKAPLPLCPLGARAVGTFGVPELLRARRPPEKERRLHDLIPPAPQPGAAGAPPGPSTAGSRPPSPRRSSPAQLGLGWRRRPKMRGGELPRFGQQERGAARRTVQPRPGKVCGGTRRQAATCRTARRGRAGPRRAQAGAPPKALDF